jgi:hypothetical protein
LDQLQTLLSLHGAWLDVDAVDPLTGRTALGDAVQSGYADVVCLLLLHGASGLKHGADPATLPLTVAAAAGHLSIVNLLLENDAAKGRAGGEALRAALRNNRSDVVRALANAGAHLLDDSPSHSSGAGSPTAAGAKPAIVDFKQPAVVLSSPSAKRGSSIEVWLSPRKPADDSGTLRVKQGLPSMKG